MNGLDKFTEQILEVCNPYIVKVAKEKGGDLGRILGKIITGLPDSSRIEAPVDH